MTFQTFTGREYLKIDIANSFGLDKLTWDDRLAWFDDHESKLDQLVSTADEPALFYAGIQAWNQVLAGEPIGYMVSLDATSSGLQLLAALTGDRSAAELCNVVDVGTRMDAYTAIYQEMLHRIQDTSKVSRDMTKDAIMTSLYGSKAVPKKVFGEGALLDVFYQTMVDMAPAAWELNEAFLALWDPKALSHDWVLPDNFHVHIKVMNRVKETVHFLNEPFEVYYSINAPIQEGRSLGANTIHSVDGMIVREVSRRCDYDPVQIDKIYDLIDKPFLHGQRTLTEADKLVALLWSHYEESGYLSARILDQIEAENLGHIKDLSVLRELLDSLPQKPFKVVAVHDCFRCLPHYANDLRRQYNNQLMLIARSQLLQSLISQIVGSSVTIGKLDPSLWKDIPETNYALS